MSKMQERPIVTMQRYEMKYVLTAAQTAYIKQQLQGHMLADRYGLTSIASLYYDTPDRRLIRASIEKPLFKEKIRLRSYGIAKADSTVYLELKRKSDKVVYKRRIATSIADAEAIFAGEKAGNEGQVEREISYFCNFYGNLQPSCLILYDRIAYYEPFGDLRLTIDHNPRYRTDHLDLTTSMEGVPLLGAGETIMEIKVQSAMPMWLCHILSQGHIYKSSFSKYGEAYKQQARSYAMVA